MAVDSEGTVDDDEEESEGGLELEEEELDGAGVHFVARTGSTMGGAVRSMAAAYRVSSLEQPADAAQQDPPPEVAPPPPHSPRQRP